MTTFAEHMADQAALTALCESGECDHPECHEDQEEDAPSKGEMKNYTIAVCELDSAGHIMGTHHVSSTAAQSVEEAKEWALNDTRCDWGLGDDEPIHVLFVMATPIGVDLEVIEYDECAGF